MSENPKLAKVKIFHDGFPSLAQIYKYLENIVSLHPDLVRVEEIGRSHSGKKIHLVVLSKGCEVDKKGVFLEGGAHSREWLGISTVLYVVEYLLKNRGLLTYMDFYIVPCLNPDGYDYTHTTDRLWRKNLNPNDSLNKADWGVDLNRNFPHGYGRCKPDNTGPGSSGDKANQMYRGTVPLSEPESAALAAALHKHGKKIGLYISVHCYGNLIMYPWGFTKAPTSDSTELRMCAEKARTAIVRHSARTRYRVGRLAHVMYLSSGCTADYARGDHGIKFSYTIELPRGGKSGFTPRASRIQKVGQEMIVGLRVMVKFVHRYYKQKYKHIQHT